METAYLRLYPELLQSPRTINPSTSTSIPKSPRTTSFIHRELSANKKQLRSKVIQHYGHTQDRDVLSVRHYQSEQRDTFYDLRCNCTLNSCKYCNFTKKASFLRKRKAFIESFNRHVAILVSTKNVSAQDVTPETYQNLIQQFKRLRDRLRMDEKRGHYQVSMKKGVYVVETVLHQKGDPIYKRVSAKRRRQGEAPRIIGEYDADVFNIHIHALVDMEYVPQAYLQERWAQITGQSGAVLHIQLLKEKTDHSYLTKYINKQDTHDNSLLFDYEKSTHRIVTRLIGAKYEADDRLSGSKSRRMIQPPTEVSVHLQSTKLMGSFGERTKNPETGEFELTYTPEEHEPTHTTAGLIEESYVRASLTFTKTGVAEDRLEAFNEDHVEKRIHLIRIDELAEQEQRQDEKVSSNAQVDEALDSASPNYTKLVELLTEPVLNRMVETGMLYEERPGYIRRLI